MDVLSARTVLCSLETEQNKAVVTRDLDELERLLDTAGGTCVGRMVQKLEKVNTVTYFGSGKIKELSVFCAQNDVNLIVFDAELSPSQIRNIEDAIETEVDVIDRTMLILDIFAQHAHSAEGKLQVELAQLRYSSPRLVGKGKDMSRLGGGIGSRGPGESQLELDRRHIQSRLIALETQLQALMKNRQTMRASRDRSGLPKIAIVGYTNAGKSTLLNTLTDAGVLAEDKLFATLDPTTRKLSLPSGEEVLLTDTVGLIRKLPHHLIRAFYSTLEEAVLADVLMIVVDASDDEKESQLQVTEDLLLQLGASGKPTVLVYNKCDDVGLESGLVSMAGKEIVTISAKTGQGIDLLLDAITLVIHGGKRNVTFLIPNAKAGLLDGLYRNAHVDLVDYGADGIHVKAWVDDKVYGRLKEFEVK